MSKYSPKWFANQRRLAAMGVQANPYNDTFAGTYGTAGGGLAGVKAGQMQSGPSAYTAEEASQLARTGTIPKPAPNVASIFSSSIPTQSSNTVNDVINETSSENKNNSTSEFNNFNLDNFSSLLSRLEESKGRQERQTAVEKRKNTFNKGLASKLRNF